MSLSRSVSPLKKSDDKKQEEKRFLNGWTKEQEQLMADWSDIALCYRWLHDNAEKIYHAKNLWINLPVIILTTLGGTASFGVQSIFANNDTMKQYASFAIGGVSLFAGILTTVGNYLRYAQLEESNRVASIAWGKFQRLIAVELAINPNERIDAMDFLKICRSDLDRLIEQSPPIPKNAIEVFESKFGSIKHLKKPDICGALEHTNIFDSNETRLKQVAVDATILMKQRRHTLNELLSPQIQETIDTKVSKHVHAAIEMKKKEFEADQKGQPDFPRREGRNRLLIRPTVHKMEYHPIQLKPMGGETNHDTTLSKDAAVNDIAPLRDSIHMKEDSIAVPLSAHPQLQRIQSMVTDNPLTSPEVRIQISTMDAPVSTTGVTILDVAKPVRTEIKPISLSRPMTKLVDKPANKPADKPANKPADKPADKPANKPADKPADKLVDKSQEKSDEKK